MRCRYTATLPPTSSLSSGQERDLRDLVRKSGGFDFSVKRSGRDTIAFVLDVHDEHAAIEKGEGLMAVVVPRGFEQSTEPL